MTEKSDTLKVSRRDLIGGAAKATAVAGLGAVAVQNARPALASEHNADYVLAPGELDEYYGIWSSGQSGEIRILGVPINA